MEWFNNRRLLRPIGDTNDHLEDLKFVMPIKAIVDKNGGAYEKDWRSLKPLEVALALTGKTEDQTKKTVAPLRELRSLRSLRHPAKAQRRKATLKWVKINGPKWVTLIGH